MKNCDLTAILLKKINKSCFVVTECYSTNKYYTNSNSIADMNSVVMCVVNFANKTSNMIATTLDPTMEYVTVIDYRNYNKYTTEYSTMATPAGIKTGSVVNYSHCSYNQLFEPCGALYPINLEGLKPINNSNNSETFQAYTFDKKRACTIEGYVSSLVTINWKSQNYFEVIMDIITKDALGRNVQSIATVTMEIGNCKQEEEEQGYCK